MGLVPFSEAAVTPEHPLSTSEGSEKTALPQQAMKKAFPGATMLAS